MSTGERAVQLAIPMATQVPEGRAADLALRLDWMWTGQARPDGSCITSVATAVGRRRGRTVLILFLTIDDLPPNSRVDDQRMAHELCSTIDDIMDGGQRDGVAASQVFMSASS